MYKFKINKFQESYAFLWDGKDETIDLINQYLKEVKGNNWSTGRCWNDETQKNDSDHLFISERNEPYTSNTFFGPGQYVVHTEGGYFHPYSKDDLVRKNIELIEYV